MYGVDLFGSAMKKEWGEAEDADANMPLVALLLLRAIARHGASQYDPNLLSEAWRHNPGGRVQELATEGMFLILFLVLPGMMLAHACMFWILLTLFGEISVCSISAELLHKSSAIAWLIEEPTKIFRSSSGRRLDTLFRVSYRTNLTRVQ
jgi:hypothetical protein